MDVRVIVCSLIKIIILNSTDKITSAREKKLSLFFLSGLVVDTNYCFLNAHITFDSQPIHWQLTNSRRFWQKCSLFLPNLFICVQPIVWNRRKKKQFSLSSIYLVSVDVFRGVFLFATMCSMQINRRSILIVHFLFYLLNIGITSSI